MKKIFHYTRGYCPIPLEKRNFFFYLKIKKFIFNKFLIFNPFGTFLLSFLFIFFSFVFLSFIFLSLSYGNIHFLAFEKNSLYFCIFFINLIYLLIFINWKNLQNSVKESITKYEEIGTLEERVWKKPVINLIQDNLILQYKIKPIIEKIRSQFVFYNVIGFFLLNFFEIFI